MGLNVVYAWIPPWRETSEHVGLVQKFKHKYCERMTSKRIRTNDLRNTSPSLDRWAKLAVTVEVLFVCMCCFVLLNQYWGNRSPGVIP